MLRLGYELASGTELAEPLAWFNFQIDAVYLIGITSSRIPGQPFSIRLVLIDTLWDSLRDGVNFTRILLRYRVRV